MKILLLSLVTAHLGMLLSFGLFRIYQKEVIADIAWALGISIQASIYYLFSTPSAEKSWLMVLVWIWGLRLAGFLYWNRIHLPWQDKRYEKIIANSKQTASKTIFLNYQIQAFLQWIMGLAWFFIMYFPHFSKITLVFSSILFFLGLSIEVIADEQLKEFKKNPVSKVCQIGLWAYSRHPNYFGEILIWISFAFASLNIFSVISPLCLYGIMRFITGPLTEQTSIEHKGQAYLDYQKNTPMIFPYKALFSRRSK